MEPYTVVDLHLWRNQLNIDNYDNLFWVISRNSIEKNIYNDYTSNIIVSYTLERRPTYLLYTIMLPVCLLNFVTLLAFILPAESGERVSFATTMLLTLTMYMTIMSDSIPNTSDPVSILTVSLMIKLIISALIVLCVIISLRVHNICDDRPIPKWLLHCSMNSGRVEGDNDEGGDVILSGARTAVTWKTIAKRLDVGFLSLYLIVAIVETVTNVAKIAYRL
ncbi:neuronal acetylcholine receptor subunit alpha-7-like [Argopecten irradians]|uniref:neuronal acetylcholine receptor subunit alpha-7-like n=1 Tax=Argopecten irradians TaxID=31199 RepID=UPI0037206A49